MTISQSDRYDLQQHLQLTQLSKRVSYAVTTGMAMLATLLALLIDLQFSV